MLQHIDQGGVATCHQGDSHLYWTAQAGTCHIFETDFLTLCPGLVDGTRGLTPHETRALKRHIAAIVQSICLP